MSKVGPYEYVSLFKKLKVNHGNKICRDSNFRNTTEPTAQF